MVLLARFVSVLVPSRSGHWIEVYGDRGTLVLEVVTIRKITFMVFANFPSGTTLANCKFRPSRLSQTYPDGRIAPFIRVIDSWNCCGEGTDTVTARKEFITVVDGSTLESATGCWVNVPSLGLSFLPCS